MSQNLYLLSYREAVLSTPPQLHEITMRLPEQPPGSETRSPLRILLAEDNLINQKVALRMLERLGYHADVVANGHEVLVATARQLYDLILMDVQMPGMDGLETTRRLRAQASEERPRIVAMTAHAMHGDQEMCLEAGMDDYVTKPISLEVLDAVLRQARQRLM